MYTGPGMAERLPPSSSEFPHDPQIHIRHVLRDQCFFHDSFVNLLGKYPPDSIRYRTAASMVFAETLHYCHYMIPSQPVDMAVQYLQEVTYATKKVRLIYSHYPLEITEDGIEYTENYDQTDDILLSVVYPFEESEYLFEESEKPEVSLYFTPLFLHDAVHRPLYMMQRVIKAASQTRDILTGRQLFEGTTRFSSMRAQALQAEFLNWYTYEFPEFTLSPEQTMLQTTYPRGYHTLPVQAR